MSKGSIKIGDDVKWRGCFGMDAARTATVTGMEITDLPRQKYGKKVNAVPVSLVRANRVVFNLSNGHWAYADQIEPY